MIGEFINKNYQILKYLIWSLGIGLLLSEFLFGRSMWTDEAKLAMNVVDKGFWELTQTLNYNQSAPILFLWLAKLFQALFGNGDLALRLAPFIIGLSSIPLFTFLLERVLKDRVHVLLGTLFFVLNGMFLYYSVEFKQYIGDLFVWVLLFGIYFSDRKDKWVWLGWMGMICFFLSNATIIYLTTIMVLTLVNQRGEIWKNKAILIANAKWLVSVILFYFAVVHNNPLKDFMLDFWGQYFPPKNVLSLEYWDFVLATTFAHMAYYLGKQDLMFGIFLGISLIGFSIGKKREGLILLLLPIVIHQALSYFRFYPFFNRFLVYAIPLMIVSFFWAIEELEIRIKESKPSLTRLSRILLPLIGVVVFSPGFTNFKPSQKEEIVPALNVLHEKCNPADMVYVYYGAKFAMMRYESVYSLKKLHYGSVHREENEKYFPEIDSLVQGNNRIWFVFSHLYPWDGRPTEADVFYDHIMNKGTITFDTNFYGARLYLFESELSQTNR